MKTQTITPRDKQHWLELRKPLITSTEVAALFGLSPWVTEYELWHRKHDNLEIEFEPNERMLWGTRLEAAIAAGVAEDEKLSIRKMDEFIFDPEKRLGASFDYAIGEDGILEIKNVDSLIFKDGWIVSDDNVEAPVHIEIQVQTQLLVSGRKYVKIAPLIGGNKVVLIHREPDPTVIKAIEERVAAFWDSIRRNDPPKPDFIKDAEFISKLYKYAEPGKVIVGTPRMGEMVLEYKRLGAIAKKADEEKDGVKAELLTMIGDAEKVQGEGFSISASMIGPAHVEYDRKPFRDFRTYIKKHKGVTA